MVQTISCEIWPSIGAHARTHSLSFTHTHLHTHTRSSFCVSHWRGPTNSSPLCHYRWSDTQITSEPNGSGRRNSKDGRWWWCVQWSQSIDSLIHSAKFNCFWWSRTEPHTHCSQSWLIFVCVCVGVARMNYSHWMGWVRKSSFHFVINFCGFLLRSASVAKCHGIGIGARNSVSASVSAFRFFGPDAFCRGGGHSVFGTVTKTKNH